MRCWRLSELFSARLLFPPRIAAYVVPTGPGGQLQALYTGSYALLIGVSRYDNPAWSRLDSIPAELEQLAEVLRKTGFDRVDLVLDPTGEDLRRAVREFPPPLRLPGANPAALFFRRAWSDTR